MAELYHLGIPVSAVPRVALLIDPRLPVGGAVRAINGVPLASRREYLSHLGQWDGQDVLVTTVGIGAPPLAIAVEELSRAGTRAFVLLGTATLSPTLAGRWLLPHGATRQDGTSAQYAPLEFPALPDPLLRRRLACASGDRSTNGVVETMDVLDGSTKPVAPAVAQDLRCAALFVVAAARRVAAAALLIAFDVPDAESPNIDDVVRDMALAAYLSLTAIE